jgi:plasmid maintenance system antidote protein VapI
MLTYGNMNTERLLKRPFKTSRLSCRFSQERDKQLFHIHIQTLCEAMRITPDSVIAKLDVDHHKGAQLFDGTLKPSRDMVIRLAFAFEMTLDKAQTLLSSARKNPLNMRIERDAAIAYALHGNLSIAATQTLLEELGLPVLGDDAPHRHNYR